MIGLGIVFLILGFVLMIPSDSVPGSVAVRNVRFASSHIFKTPGHVVDFVRRTRWIKVLVGIALFGIGLLLIAIGS